MFQTSIIFILTYLNHVITLCLSVLLSNMSRSLSALSVNRLNLPFVLIFQVSPAVIVVSVKFDRRSIYWNTCRMAEVIHVFITVVFG